MKNLLIVYKSKYGTTEKYAYEIKEKTNADIYKLKDIKNINFDKYGTVIYGGRAFAGTIDGLSKFIKKFENQLKDKKILIFVVGANSTKSLEKIKTLKEANTPKNLNTEIFYFRGALDSRNLTFIEKMMMRMIKSKIMKVPENKRDEDEKVIIESFEKKVDFFDEKAIDFLIREIK
ncbi:MAG: flavodoxin domain-containing protein [Sarcina sp.]